MYFLTHLCVQHAIAIHYMKRRSKHKKAKSKDVTIAFDAAEEARDWLAQLRAGAANDAVIGSHHRALSDTSSFAAPEPSSFVSAGHEESSAVPETPKHMRMVCCCV
jgi:hypothetical protein